MPLAEQDGCLEDFENTAEFSKKYQGAQDCLCDKVFHVLFRTTRTYSLQEHMHSCPESREEAMENMPEEIDSLSDAIDMYFREQVRDFLS